MNMQGKQELDIESLITRYNKLAKEYKSRIALARLVTRAKIANDHVSPILFQTYIGFQVRYRIQFTDFISCSSFV